MGANTGDASFTTPRIDGKLEVDLAGPADEVRVGGSGKYIVLLIKKLRQLAVFDVSQAKVVKYLPIPSTDIEFTASAKKLFIGVKDLKRIQRWDLAKQELELTVAAPEGGIADLATGASSTGPVILLGEKRFWLLNPMSLKAEPYPSKNWGTDGSAWGPVHARVSFDGTTAIAYGGGWAGVELSTITNNKATLVNAGSYVHGDAYISGNGGLVFSDEGGTVRSDLKTKVTGIEGKAFPAIDPAFSLAIQKQDRKNKEARALVVYANADPRPLVTLRDLPEIDQESKMPASERIFLIPSAKVLVTLGEGRDKLIMRKFDLASELEAEGIDYLFVESAPVIHAQPGSRYNYKMVVRSKKGSVKCELQSGPKGMTISKEGMIQWAVPTRPPEDQAAVIVQISDASGQSIFHTFSIGLGELPLRK